MNNNKNDITRSIFSESDVRRKMGRIFSDAVVLNNQFNIVAVSRNVCETLGYQMEELRGSSISVLSQNNKLKELLEEKLQAGFFEEQPVAVQTKQDRLISYSISGYYLGLIADVNDLIILKFRNVEEIKFINSQLEVKTLELDGFVYQTAHRLRGPLATLKGLIQMATNNNNRDELDFLTAQMNVFADRLDDILHNLVYFAEADKAQEKEVDKLTLASIAETLRLSAELEGLRYPIRFRVNLPEPLERVNNGKLTGTLLRNMQSFFCQYPDCGELEVYFSGQTKGASLEMVLRIKGIALTEKLRGKIEAANFGYVEILNEPELTGLYAAKKIILKLKGYLFFTFPDSEEVGIHITIPKSTT